MKKRVVKIEAHERGDVGESSLRRVLMKDTLEFEIERVALVST